MLEALGPDPDVLGPDPDVLGLDRMCDLPPSHFVHFAGILAAGDCSGYLSQLQVLPRAERGPDAIRSCAG